MNIQLHIERLVLDGVDLAPQQRGQLQAALSAELTVLLRDGGMAAGLAGGAALSRLNLSGLSLTGNDPNRLGRQIAQGVYRGIGDG